MPVERKDQLYYLGEEIVFDTLDVLKAGKIDLTELSKKAKRIHYADGRIYTGKDVGHSWLRFLVADDVIWLFDEELPWIRAYELMQEKLGKKVKLQSAGSMYFFYVSKDETWRNISGYSRVLHEKGILNIRDSNDYKGKVIAPKLERHFNIT